MLKIGGFLVEFNIAISKRFAAIRKWRLLSLFVQIPHPADVLFLTIAILLAFAAAPSHASGITYTYDSLGRVVTLTYDNGTQITYAYDAAGNRTTQGVVCGTGGC
jgi:YD repeat-containing protein